MTTTRRHRPARIPAPEQLIQQRLAQVNYANHTPSEWQLICDGALGVPWWFEGAYERWVAANAAGGVPERGPTPAVL